MTYPETVPQDLQATILDWYQFREVCDDQKFPVFFERVLRKSMPRYNQLLRIEPGVSEYDWLVQNYRELQTTNTNSGTASRGSHTERDFDGDLEHGLQTKTTYDDDTTTTYNALTDTDTAVSGTLKHEVEHGKTTTNGNAQNGQDYSTTSTHTMTGKLITKTDDNTNSDHMSLGKAAPQSSSYGSGGFPSALDWQYPGQQNEDKTVNGGYTQSSVYGEANGGQDYSETDTVTYTDKRKVTEGGKTTTTDTDTRVHTNVKSGSMEVGHDGDVTVNNTGHDVTDNHEETDVRENSSNSTSGLTQTQETGRNIDIATLLSNAKGFILSTSAWEWLSGRIDTCFMGIYE